MLSRPLINEFESIVGPQNVFSDPAVETDGQPQRRLTYHDPCRLKKSPSVFEQPRTLLKTHRQYRLVEIDQANACLGMDGGFNLQHDALSSDTGRLKRDSISGVRADVLSTRCPACMVHISDILSLAGDRIAVRHPIQIDAERIGCYESTAQTH